MVDIAASVSTFHLATPEEEQILIRALTPLAGDYDALLTDGKLLDRNLYVDISLFVEDIHTAPASPQHHATTPSDAPASPAANGGGLLTGLGGFLSAAATSLTLNAAANLSPARRKAHIEKKRPLKNAHEYSTGFMADDNPLAATYNTWKNTTTSLDEKAKQLVVYGILTKLDGDYTLKFALVKKVLNAGLEEGQDHPQLLSFRTALETWVKKEYTLAQAAFQKQVVAAITQNAAWMISDNLTSTVNITDADIASLTTSDPHKSVKLRADAIVFQKYREYLKEKWQTITAKGFPAQIPSGILLTHYEALASSILPPLKTGLEELHLGHLVSSTNQYESNVIVHVIVLLDTASIYLTERKLILEILGYQDDGVPSAETLQHRYDELDNITKQSYPDGGDPLHPFLNELRTTGDKPKMESQVKQIHTALIQEITDALATVTGDTSGVMDREKLNLHTLISQSLCETAGLRRYIAIDAEQTESIFTSSNVAKFPLVARGTHERLTELLIKKELINRAGAYTLKELFHAAPVEILLQMLSIKQLLEIIRVYREKIIPLEAEYEKLHEFASSFTHFREQRSTYSSLAPKTSPLSLEPSSSSGSSSHSEPTVAPGTPVSAEKTVSLPAKTLFERFFLIEIFHVQLLQSMRNNIQLFNATLDESGTPTLDDLRTQYSKFIKRKKTSLDKEKEIASLLGDSTPSSALNGSIQSVSPSNSKTKKTTQEQANATLIRDLAAIREQNSQNWGQRKQPALTYVPLHAVDLAAATKDNILKLSAHFASREVQSLLTQAAVLLNILYTLQDSIKSRSDAIFQMARDLDATLKTHYNIATPSELLADKLRLLEEKVTADKQALANVAHLLNITDHKEQISVSDVKAQCQHYEQRLDDTLTINYKVTTLPKSFEEKFRLLEESVTADKQTLALAARELGIEAEHKQSTTLTAIKKQYQDYENKLNSALLEVNCSEDVHSFTFPQKITKLASLRGLANRLLAQAAAELGGKIDHTVSANHKECIRQLKDYNANLNRVLSNLSRTLPSLKINSSSSEILSETFIAFHRAKTVLIEKTSLLLGETASTDLQTLQNQLIAKNTAVNAANRNCVPLLADVIFPATTPITLEVVAQSISMLERNLTNWFSSTRATVMGWRQVYIALGETTNTNEPVWDEAEGASPLTMANFQRQMANLETNRAKYQALQQIDGGRRRDIVSMLQIVTSISAAGYLPGSLRLPTSSTNPQDFLAPAAYQQLTRVHQHCEKFLNFILDLKKYILTDLNTNHKDLARKYYLNYGSVRGYHMTPESPLTFLSDIIDRILSITPQYVEKNRNLMLAQAKAVFIPQYELLPETAASTLAPVLPNDEYLKAIYQWHLIKKPSTGLPADYRKIEKEAFNCILDMRILELNTEIQSSQLAQVLDHAIRRDIVNEVAGLGQLCARIIESYERNETSLTDVIIAALGDKALKGLIYAGHHPERLFWSTFTVSAELVQKAAGGMDLIDKDPVKPALELFTRKGLRQGGNRP